MIFLLESVPSLYSTSSLTDGRWKLMLSDFSSVILLPTTKLSLLPLEKSFQNTGKVVDVKGSEINQGMSKG